MKLRLPNKLIAAIMAAATPALFSTLSTATLGAAAMATLGLQAMGDDVTINEGESMAIGDISTPATLHGSGILTTANVPSGLTYADDWTGVVMLTGKNLGVNTDLDAATLSRTSSFVGLKGVSNVDTHWDNGTISANIYFENNTDGFAWKYNNGASGTGANDASKTLTFSGVIKGDGTLWKAERSSRKLDFNQNFTFTGDISGWTGSLTYANATSNSNNSIVTFEGSATTINTQVKYTYAASDSEALEVVLGDITAEGVDAYTFNNTVNVDVLSAAGKNVILGSNTKADGTTITHGSLTLSKSSTIGSLTINSGATADVSKATNTIGSVAVKDGGKLVLGTGDENILMKATGEGTIALGNQSSLTVAGGASVATVFTGALEIGTGTLTLGQAVGGNYGSSPNVSTLSSISLGGGNLNIVGWGSNHYHSLTALADTVSTLTIYQHDNAMLEGSNRYVFEDTTTVAGTLNLYAGANSSYGTCTENRAGVEIESLSGSGNLVLGQTEDDLRVTVDSWGDFSGNITVSEHASLSAASLPSSAKFSGSGRVEISDLLGGDESSPLSAAFSGVSADEKFTGTLSLKRQDVSNHNCTLTLTNFAGTLDWRGHLNLNGTNFGDASKIVLNTDGVTNCTSLWANNGNKTLNADIQIVGSGTAEINADRCDFTLNGALTGGASSTFRVTTVNQTVTLAGNVEGFDGTYHIGAGALAFQVTNGAEQTISNTITGTAIFRKTGAGTLNFGGTLKPGVTLQNRDGGKLVMDNITVDGTNGRLNISDGTVTFKNGITDTAKDGSGFAMAIANGATAEFTSGEYDFSNANIAAYTTGTFKVATGATVKVSASHWSTGSTYGSLTVEDGGKLVAGKDSTISNGLVRVTNFTNSGVAELHGTATITHVVNSGGTLSLLGTQSKNITDFTQSGETAKLVINNRLDVTTDLASEGSVQGSIDLKEGASLHIKNLGASVSADLKDLTLATNAVMGVYTGSNKSESEEGKLSVSGTLTSETGAKLNANLTLNNGATLAVADGGLHMGSSVTIANDAHVSLSDNIISGLNSLTVGNGLTLFWGVDAFTIGGSSYDAGTTYHASDYFYLAGVNRPWDFVIKYETPAGSTSGGTVSLWMETPEPATATLSLLALAALAARRKRK